MFLFVLKLVVEYVALFLRSTREDLGGCPPYTANSREMQIADQNAMHDRICVEKEEYMSIKANLNIDIYI